jgi:hypothetical protein
MLMKNVELPPRPSSLVESLRDIGYSIETAIADIIDNSITASAKNIHIRFSWNSGYPWLAIIDDGCGMSESDLIDAMRFGSQNPLESRDKNDLGRFGLGLKTASFSQCRSLTVYSKKDKRSTGAQWDLDLLSNLANSNWSLSVFDDQSKIETPQNLKYLEKTYLENISSGTIVIWTKIDRLDEGTVMMTKENHFNDGINSVRKHLELVFHRYLVPEPGQSKINIFFNSTPLVAFDPFNTTKSTELHSEEFLYEKERITVQPYILPHHSKVSHSEWKKYAGDRGYLQEQGFYVYRNRRLIIYGTWFRLIGKDELTKLLRVKVDIPNSLDHIWKIDVKKSNAFPPVAIREGLKRIIGKIEHAGKKVFNQRGQKLSSQSKVPGWVRVAKDNQLFYEINKEHPLLNKFIKSHDETSNKLFTSILDLLESSFPRDAYFNDIATSPETVSVTDLDKAKIETLLSFFISDSINMPDKNLLLRILQTDPFATNQEITKIIFKERGYDY